MAANIFYSHSSFAEGADEDFVLSAETQALLEDLCLDKYVGVAAADPSDLLPEDEDDAPQTTLGMLCCPLLSL